MSVSHHYTHTLRLCSLSLSVCITSDLLSHLLSLTASRVESSLCTLERQVGTCTTAEAAAHSRTAAQVSIHVPVEGTGSITLPTYDQYSVRVGLSGSKKQVHFDNLPLDNQARYPGHWASGQSSYGLGIFCISSGRDNELGYPTVTCQTRAILPPRYPLPI